MTERLNNNKAFDIQSFYRSANIWDAEFYIFGFFKVSNTDKIELYIFFGLYFVRQYRQKTKKNMRAGRFWRQGEELLMGEGFLGICDENVIKSIVVKIVQLNKYTKNPLNCTL